MPYYKTFFKCPNCHTYRPSDVKVHYCTSCERWVCKNCWTGYNLCKDCYAEESRVPGGVWSNV